MKKLLYICVILMGAMMFVSCKNEKVEAVEEEVVVEAAVDSLEALEAPIDTAHVM